LLNAGIVSLRKKANRACRVGFLWIRFRLRLRPKEEIFGRTMLCNSLRALAMPSFHSDKRQHAQNYQRGVRGGARRHYQRAQCWCGRPDLNRHGKLLPRDFKSLASTISPRPRERAGIAHPRRRAAIRGPKSRGCLTSSSWPDLFRPSTSLLAGIKDVDARDERGMTTRSIRSKSIHRPRVGVSGTTACSSPCFASPSLAAPGGCRPRDR
jgi:hypothetical protein